MVHAILGVLAPGDAVDCHGYKRHPNEELHGHPKEELTTEDQAVGDRLVPASKSEPYSSLSTPGSTRGSTGFSGQAWSSPSLTNGLRASDILDRGGIRMGEIAGGDHPDQAALTI
jgi:hypothetical protein